MRPDKTDQSPETVECSAELWNPVTPSVSVYLAVSSGIWHFLTTQWIIFHEQLSFLIQMPASTSLQAGADTF